MSDIDADMELVPAGAELPDVVPDVDPATLAYGQQLTWERQERFLDGYSRFGTVYKSRSSSRDKYPHGPLLG